MKYANGACCPWIPRERETNDEVGGGEDFLIALRQLQHPKQGIAGHQRQQAQMPGMAYVPMQVWKKPYEREIGFQRGTIFHALDKPFLGDEGAC